MVFATELDRTRNPLRSRMWGIIAGTLLLCAVAAGLASPRTLAFTVPLLALSLVASRLPRGNSIVADLFAAARDAPWPQLAAFAALAVASTAWSQKPLASVHAPLWLALYVAVSWVATTLMLLERRANSFHMAEGLWIGLIAGLAYLLVELLGNQSVKIALFNALHLPKSILGAPENLVWKGDVLVAISPIEMSRSIAPVTLLLWPALLSLRAGAPWGGWRMWSALLFGLAAVVVIISGHETSKAALIASSLIYVMSAWWRATTARMLQIGIVAACLLAVPFAIALYRADLHHNPALQYSLQHRIVIWNRSAETVMERPILGLGAGMMYELAPDAAQGNVDPKFSVKSPHAHSIFLQTWVELGAIGAGLLMLAGLAVVRVLQRVPAPHAPFLYATFAAAATMAAATYSLWQVWFLGLFALCALCSVLAVRVNEPDVELPPSA